MISTKSATLLLTLGAIAPVHAICEVYMSDQEAAQKLFPGQNFNKGEATLTTEQTKEIERLSGESVRSKTVRYLQSARGERVYVDQVLGKHEYITFAAAVDDKGLSQGLEILEYRESYGHQVRKEAWRAQFKGKAHSESFALDKDIKNISGATLSSSHLSKGIKRVLCTHFVLTQSH